MAYYQGILFPKCYTNIKGIVEGRTDNEVRVYFDALDERQYERFIAQRFYSQMSNNSLEAMRAGIEVRCTAWMFPPTDEFTIWHITSMFPLKERWSHVALPEPIIEITGVIYRIDSPRVGIRFPSFNRTVTVCIKDIENFQEGASCFEPRVGDCVVVQALFIHHHEVIIRPIKVLWHSSQYQKVHHRLNKHLNLTEDVLTHIENCFENNHESLIVRDVTGIIIRMSEEKCTIYVRAFNATISVNLSEIFVNGQRWNTSMNSYISVDSWLKLWFKVDMVRTTSRKSLFILTAIACFWTSNMRQRVEKSILKMDMSEPPESENTLLKGKVENLRKALLEIEDAEPDEEIKIGIIIDVQHTHATLNWENARYQFKRKQLTIFGLPVTDIDLRLLLSPGG